MTLPPPSQATPATDASSTHERVREVAAELFAERGFAGTSMAEIASRVGIRKPSLYNHTASKEELFMELLERSLEAWGLASAPPFDGDGSCRERLHRHLEATVAFAAQDPHAMALCRLAVTQLTGEVAERARALLRGQRFEYQRRIEELFTAARDAGEVTVAASPETLTLAWLTFLDGFLSHQVFSLGDRSATYRERLDDLWRLFWRGVADG